MERPHFIVNLKDAFVTLKEGAYKGSCDYFAYNLGSDTCAFKVLLDTREDRIS